jgi:hypothetical protein
MFDRGAVFVDGQPMRQDTGAIDVLAPPAWRLDGLGLAWLERHRGDTRLVVLPELGASLLAWSLPRSLGHERVHWADDNRVVVGPVVTQPLAIASW